MGSDKYSVSAVIAAYNAECCIERTLASVYAQTRPPDECIVVDDGSSDRTVEVIGQHFPQVTVLQQANAGPAAAYNRAVRAASGDLVAFLDHDDEWLPEKLERQIAVLRDYPEASGVLCRPLVVDGVHPPPILPDEQPVVELGFRSWFFGTNLQGIHRGMSSWLFRREAFALPFGGLDETISSFADFEALLRWGALGHRILGLRQQLYRYHLRGTSLGHSREGQLAQAELVPRLLRRYHPATAPGADLLTPVEFCTRLQYALKKSVGFAVRWGEWEAARRYLQEAAACPGQHPWLRLEMTAGARCPGLYLALRRRCLGRRR